jgi:hypothetical protein
MELQVIANSVCDRYNVTHVPIKTQTSPLNNGLAYYATYRIRKNGRIDKTNHPRYICIANYTGRIPILELAHELAHHILNVKSNSLAHTGKHGALEDTIGIYISRLIK